MVKTNKNLKIAASVLSALVTTQFFGVTTSVRAADTVVVDYGPFTDTIPVSDLQQVADTGKFPEDLDFYADKLSPQQRSLFIGALRTKIPINVVTVSNLLDTQIGTTVLSDLSQAIHRKDTAKVQALRAALVLGSTAPQGLSVLSFIHAYPSRRLEINLPQAFAAVGNFNINFWRTQQFLMAIAPRLASKKPQISFPFDPTQPGTAKVQVLNLNFNDQKRQRQIPADIYWSTAASTEKPIIIFSHGLGSVRTELRYLAEHLASYGYIVVSPEHPGSNEANTDAALEGKNRLLQPQEFLERPKDISFVLDEVEKLNRTPGNPLQGRVAINNVMVIGYSFGGGTALSLGGAELQLEHLKQRCKNNLAVVSLGEGIQCVAQELPENNYQLRDSRVKAVIAISPTASLMFGETGLSKIQVPTLVWTASADKTTPALTEQIVGFENIPSPNWLVGIVGGTHLSVKDPSATLDQKGKANTPFSGGEVVGDQAADIRKYLKAIALSTAAQLTPEASKYTVFLTPDYAQFSSTQDFPMRLITEIPPDAKTIIKEFTLDK